MVCTHLTCIDMALLCAAARHIPHLQCLDLFDNPLGPGGFQPLAQAARHWPELQRLMLGRTGVGGGVRDIEEAAPHWNKLKVLDVSRLHTHQYSATGVDMKYVISAARRHFPLLEELSVDAGCKQGRASCQTLMSQLEEARPSWPMLKTLRVVGGPYRYDTDKQMSFQEVFDGVDVTFSL